MKNNYRICLILGNAATSVQGSTIFIGNIYDTLIGQGHDVFLISFADMASEITKTQGKFDRNILCDKMYDSFNKEYINNPFDLLLSFLDANFASPEFFQKLKEKVFTVNYTTNYHQFKDLHAEIAPYIDLNTYISLPHKAAYESVGAKCYWMPMAANPELYVNNKDKIHDISFVGSSYGNRPYYLWRILQNEIDINIYGPSWNKRNIFNSFIRTNAEFLLCVIGTTTNRVRFLERNKRRKIIDLLNEKYPNNVRYALSDNDMFQIYGSSKIIVNFQESRVNHDYINSEVLFGANFRDFEAPMSGALLLTQYSDELGHFYKEGEEVVSFKNEFEMVDKIKYYLSHPGELNKIAQNGNERARNEHTWDNRFNKLFDYLRNELHVIK